MRYLKFYEAFKSKGISNTIKFLKEKVGNSASESFISSLKDFMTNIDFPIDQISDENVKYLSAKKAIKLKSEKQVTNSKGIWVIKYWFSLQKGFLGFTATGNETKPVTDEKWTNGFRDQQLFSDLDLNKIKEDIIGTGEIWPVNNYNKLKTGDTVIGQFDGRIAMAKIFIDHRDSNRTYAIQSVASGSEADDSDWRNYRQYGNLSWWIFDNSEIGSDHRKLHHWRQSQEELHYIEPPVVIEDQPEEKEEDPFEWNLPLSNRYSFSSWGRGSSIKIKDVKEADFAIILYFDDLINPESDAPYFEKPSETIQQRKQEKQGATKLMSDDEIKKMNIERYIQKLVVSLNITETEFFNLEKIVSKHLSQEFSYISIYHQRPDWSDLTDFTDYLYQVVDSSSDKEYYINRVKDLYKRKTESYYNHFLKYQTNKTFIKGDSPLKKIFDEIFKLGSEINVIFTKKQLNTIDDLWLTSKKIRSLYDYIRMSRNQLNYGVREVLGGFRYTDEISYYFSNHENQYSEDNYKQDLEIINRIRGFMKTL